MYRSLTYLSAPEVAIFFFLIVHFLIKCFFSMRYTFNFFLLLLALSIAILKLIQCVSPFPQNIVYAASIICNTRVQ